MGSHWVQLIYTWTVIPVRGRLCGFLVLTWAPNPRGGSASVNWAGFALSQFSVVAETQKFRKRACRALMMLFLVSDRERKKRTMQRLFHKANFIQFKGQVFIFILEPPN